LKPVGKAWPVLLCSKLKQVMRVISYHYKSDLRSLHRRVKTSLGAGVSGRPLGKIFLPLLHVCLIFHRWNFIRGSNEWCPGDQGLHSNFLPLNLSSTTHSQLSKLGMTSNFESFCKLMSLSVKGGEPAPGSWFIFNMCLFLLLFVV
jgi:hypothetical protein